MSEIRPLNALSIEGLAADSASVLSIPAANPSGGFKLVADGLSGSVKSYTLVYDLYVPNGSPESYNGLFQTNPDNSDDGDAFMRRTDPDHFGIGISGQYQGDAAFDAWHRIAITLEHDGGDNVAMNFYIDGELVNAMVKEVDRYAFDGETGLLILADENGETMDQSLASFAFVPRALDADTIAGLGGVNALGIASGIPGALEFSFEDGDLSPTIGAGSLTPRDAAQAGTVTTADALGIPELPVAKNVLAFDAADAAGGFAVAPELDANATSFSLVYDILIPAGQDGYGGLFQTDAENASDSDLFLRTNGDGTFGVGISGQYDGAVGEDTWARLVFTFEDQGDGTSLLSKYVDGALVGEQAVETARFTVDAEKGFFILTDEDGETYEGYLANFAFGNRTLTAAEVAALGDASADAIPTSLLGDNAAVFDFAGGIEHGTIEPRDGNAAMIDRTYDPEAELTPENALAFEAAGPAGGFLLDTGFDGAADTFTLVYDLRIEPGQEGSYAGLFQTDGDNSTDADLFLQLQEDGTYGIGIGGQYEGSVAAGEWARVAFTVSANGDGTSLLQKFVDGEMVGEQTVETARFTIDADNRPFIMTDNDGETLSGQLASFALADRALSAAEVADLGGTTPGGVFGIPVPGQQTVEFDFLGSSKIDNGAADASVGTGTIVDREFETVGVQQEVLSQLLKVGDHVEIDVADIFTGDNLTFTVKGEGGEALDATLEDGVLSIDAKGIGFTDFTVVATDDLGNSAEDSFRVRVAGENAYTIAVFPDTQDYSGATQDNIIGHMTSFLAANKDSLNVSAVLHVGDVTGSNTTGQWQNVSNAYEALEEAGIPYTLLPGNHDQAAGGSANDHTSNIDQFFDLERYYAVNEGGVYDGEPDSVKNNFKTFTAPDGTDWVVLSLEFGPRDDVIRWGNEVLSEYSDHRAIVLTHHYTNMADVAGPRSGAMYGEGTGKNYGMSDSDEAVNDGRDLWDNLVSKHGNVSFVFSGHVFGDGAETIVETGEQGNAVAQMFVNYQNGVSPIAQTAGLDGVSGNGGNGAMRLVTIDPDNDAVYTETYYTELDTYMTASRGDPEPSRDGKGLDGEGGSDRVIQPVEFGTTAELGFPDLPDDDGMTHMIATPQFDNQNGLLVDPGYAPEAADKYLDYTLVWDMFVPENIGLISLLQTDTTNLSDGDLWLQQGAEGGLFGTSGQDDGPFELGGWRRVVAVFEAADEYGSSYRLDKYVDGKLMGSQILSGDQYVIKEGGFIVFGDDGSETPAGSGLSSFAMIGKAMTGAEVEALGGVTANGPFSELPEGVDGTQFDFENGDFTPTFGQGSMTQDLGAADDEVDLTGAYREHQETLTGIGIKAPTVQFNADAGADQAVDLTETAKVVLDGSGSVDKLGQVESAVWTNADGEVVATGITAGIDGEGGANRYTLTLTDANGVKSTDSVLVAGLDEKTMLFDGFDDGDLDGWTVESGLWTAAGAANSPTARAEGHLQANTTGSDGLIVYTGADASLWDGYTVSAEIENENDQPMGIAAGITEDGDMYRLVFDVTANETRLEKLEGGEATVLAVDSDCPPYDRPFLAELSVLDGSLMAAIDGKLLFGGAVADEGAPLTGTVGVFHESTFRADIDYVSVREGSLIVDAGEDIRVLDLDGDGVESVSFAADGTAIWSTDGKVLGEGEITVDLGAGNHLVRLDQTLDGESGHDTAMIEVVAKEDILLVEDFETGADGWTFVDEGELGQAAAWSVEDGRLVQSENRYSRQLMGSGDTAPNAYWALSWSPLGDGFHALRKGTYALLEDEASKEWTDYSVAFDFTAPSGGAVGLMFHYQDDKNYYKLELDRAGGTSQLLSVKNGIEQIYWQASPDYDIAGSNRLRVDIEGGEISASVDGMDLFGSIEIHDVEKGGIGLYNWGAPDTSYDNLEVVRLGSEAEEPAPEGEHLVGTMAADALRGGDGFDTLEGRGGDDLLDGRGGHDLLSGGAGEDTLVGRYGDDTLDGGVGDDLLQGNVGNDLLKGAAGADTLEGGEGVDTLEGGSGADVLKGGHGNDVLDGGQGADWLHGATGNDQLAGGLGDDTMFGGEGSDALSGGRGNDVLNGGAGDDVLDGGQGDDVLQGGQGNDMLAGGLGSDVLFGGEGADWLQGNQGADTLMGGNGADTLSGGVGDDLLVGGEGADLFIVGPGSGIDRIRDFSGTGGEGDRIDVSAYGIADFAELTALLSETGTRTDIALTPSGDTLILTGVSLEDLKADDFVF